LLSNSLAINTTHGPHSLDSTTGGAINNSSVQQLVKHELYLAKKQLVDAQNSYQFLKREKLRVEHEKNLLEIQMRQIEEAQKYRLLTDEAKVLEIKQLHSKLDASRL
jgi:hypothetical protein